MLRRNLADADLLHRLQVGRTADALPLLKDTRLFCLDDTEQLPAKGGAALFFRGCQAQHEGRNVLVLATFVRYRVATADVTIIQPDAPDAGSPRWKLGEVFSCPLRELEVFFQN